MIFLVIMLHSIGICCTFAAQIMVIGWLGATSMQGNPVRVWNCTCSCNPLKHGVCLLNVTGLEQGWEGEADWGKSEDLPFQLIVNS